MVVFSLVVTLIHAQPAPAPIQVAPQNANTIPPGAPVQRKTKVVYKERSVYDYEETLINGNLRKPDGSFVFRKNQAPFKNSLKLRRSFMPELKESALSAR